MLKSILLLLILGLTQNNVFGLAEDSNNKHRTNMEVNVLEKPDGRLAEQSRKEIWEKTEKTVQDLVKNGNDPISLLQQYLDKKGNDEHYDERTCKHILCTSAQSVKEQIYKLDISKLNQIPTTDKNQFIFQFIFQYKELTYLKRSNIISMFFGLLVNHNIVGCENPLDFIAFILYNSGLEKFQFKYPQLQVLFTILIDNMECADENLVTLDLSNKGLTDEQITLLSEYINGDITTNDKGFKALIMEFVNSILPQEICPIVDKSIQNCNFKQALDSLREMITKYAPPELILEYTTALDNVIKDYEDLTYPLKCKNINLQGNKISVIALNILSAAAAKNSFIQSIVVDKINKRAEKKFTKENPVTKIKFAKIHATP